MKKEKIFYAICIILIAWVCVSTIEVWVHHFNGNEYHKSNCWILIGSHTTDMVVVDCQGNWDDTFTVTVEDIKGNLYDYIDDEPKENETVLRVTMCGTELINAQMGRN